MSVRPNSIPLQFLPDEARSLPPPKLTDPRILYTGFMGYCAGLLDNLLNRRPVVTAEKKTYAEILEDFYPVR
uniref:NADH:ubiquinone oxidoreductase subunit C2 n=1 Tax=Vombatus ursinus TaxID=29139 RepID=A0A4X2LCL0_VOMUR